MWHVSFSQCRCKRTLCKQEIKNGELEDLNVANKVHRKKREIYSGQKAILHCSVSFFIKVLTTNMILNGHLTNKTSIVCKYEGRQPKWVDEATGNEIVCDKECFSDKDCVQTNMHFCLNHR